jgi:tetratricopeptide (TPR) repeat protein
MKSLCKLLVVVAFFTLTASAHAAQSPSEQLKQMVVQLQKTPTDDALREKIVKLARQVKPAPAIPEEANRAFVKGNVFQKEATNVSGYELAISSYREALRVAPWWGDVYFNLSAALASSGRFEEAIASMTLYKATVHAGSGEAREAQNKIYTLEAKKEMAASERKQIEANSPQAKAKKDAELIRSLNGAKFVGETSYGSTVVSNVYEIHGQEVHYYNEVVRNPDGDSFQTSTLRPSMRNPGDNNKPAFIGLLRGREFNHESPWSGRVNYQEISEDGSTIRTLFREKGEVKDAKAQNTTEPRRR